MKTKKEKEKKCTCECGRLIPPLKYCKKCGVGWFGNRKVISDLRAKPNPAPDKEVWEEKIFSLEDIIIQIAPNEKTYLWAMRWLKKDIDKLLAQQKHEVYNQAYEDCAKRFRIRERELKQEVVSEIEKIIREEAHISKPKVGTSFFGYYYTICSRIRELKSVR